MAEKDSFSIMLNTKSIKFKSILAGIILLSAAVGGAIYLYNQWDCAFAQPAFNKKFDIRYPAAHAPCSSRVVKIENTVLEIDKRFTRIETKIDLLIELRKQRISFDEINDAVDRYSKATGMSYDSAYALLYFKKAHNR